MKVVFSIIFMYITIFIIKYIDCKKRIQFSVTKAVKSLQEKGGQHYHVQILKCSIITVTLTSNPELLVSQIFTIRGCIVRWHTYTEMCMHMIHTQYTYTTINKTYWDLNVYFVTLYRDFIYNNSVVGLTESNTELLR